MKYDYLLIDANNLLCRAHYAMRLTDSKGRTTSGIFGVLKMVATLAREFKPKIVVIAWDKGQCSRRLKIYPDYKVQRDKKREKSQVEQLRRQRKILKRIFKLLPVRQIAVNEVEADDIIGYLCEKLKGNKLIVSNDKDFLQLIHEDVNIFRVNKNGQSILNKKIAEKELGFPLKYYLLWKSMVGDTSDNIKGIPGMGEVRSAKYIQAVLDGEKPRPISAEEQKILDRNKYLMAIGAVLTESQKKKIYRSFKKQENKPVDFEEVRFKFDSLKFYSLIKGFSQFKKSFEGKSNGKEKESKQKESKQKERTRRIRSASKRPKKRMLLNRGNVG